MGAGGIQENSTQMKDESNAAVNNSKMAYTIYHIPGIKIGCSKRIENRIKEQKFNEYEILEVHTDINIASVREKELNKQYGYEWDNTQDYRVLDKIRDSSIRASKLKLSKPFYSKSLIDGKIKEHISVRECSIELGIRHKSIHRVLKGLRNYTKDYIFYYK